MNRRSVVKQMVAGLALVALSGVAAAADADFITLSPAQPTLPAGQVEVIEFFSYGCPHCYNFDPQLRKWLANQKKDVVFKRIPVSFGNAPWLTLGRLYLTLDAMHLAEKYGPQVFEAYQKDRVRLDDEKTRNEWLAKAGINVKEFNDTWRSFGIETLAKRSEQLSVTYKISSVPTLVIGGRYATVSGEGEKTLTVADSLVAKVRAGK